MKRCICIQSRWELATRGFNLDTNIRKAYRVAPRPILAAQTMKLMPAFRPLLTRGKPTVRQLKLCSSSAQNNASKSGDEATLRAAGADINRAKRTAKRAPAGKIQSFSRDPGNARTARSGI